MKTSDYIAQLMLKTNASSFAELARLLRVSRSAVTHFRQDKDQFGPETALRVATLAGVPKERVAADMMAARAKNQQTRRRWLTTATVLAALHIATQEISVPIVKAGETVYTLCAQLAKGAQENSGIPRLPSLHGDRRDLGIRL